MSAATGSLGLEAPRHFQAGRTLVPPLTVGLSTTFEDGSLSNVDGRKRPQRLARSADRRRVGEHFGPRESHDRHPAGSPRAPLECRREPPPATPTSRPSPLLAPCARGFAPRASGLAWQPPAHPTAPRSLLTRCVVPQRSAQEKWLSVRRSAPLVTNHHARRKGTNLLDAGLGTGEDSNRPRVGLRPKLPRRLASALALVVLQGLWRAESGRVHHGGRRRLADWLDVTSRTLRYWKAAAGQPEKRPVDRPMRQPADWRRSMWQVGRALARLGRTVGWRTVFHALGGSESRFAVQTVQARFKARRRRRGRLGKAGRARDMHVLGTGLAWSLDGTHLGRDEHGAAIEGQVLKDNGSRAVLEVLVGRPATGDQLIALLLCAAARRGGLPLVLITDNGGPNVSAELAAWLAAHGVLQLKNLPRTPQHNGACERANSELKADAGLGKGTAIGASSPPRNGRNGGSAA